MRITIIGAGFSGGTLATQLAATAADVLEVILVGQGDTLGRGLAYGSSRPEHLLNVRARHMGAAPDNPQEFAQWLNLSELGGEGFLPRMVYGEYLVDRLRWAKQAFPSLRCVQHEAVLVDRERDGFRVHLEDGRDFFSDYVVLALGTLPPQRVAGVGPRLSAHPRFLRDPWQEGGIDRIGRDARILIVGAGLTMADVVMTLQRRRHRGEIVALSRHGLLPQSHHEHAVPAIKLPPHVLCALRQHDLRGLVAALRSLVPVVPDWRGLVDAVRPHTQDFWRGLSMRQRAQFLRHVRSYWEVMRHRIAPSVASSLSELRNRGQLAIRAGRLLRASLVADAVDVLVRDRGQALAYTERYDALIQATGFDTDVAHTTHPLMRHLSSAGLVAPDPLGLGLRASERYEVLDVSGRAVPGLYCVGPMLRGQWWEITAVPELRAATQSLASQLFAHVLDRMRAPHALAKDLLDGNIRPTRSGCRK